MENKRRWIYELRVFLSLFSTFHRLDTRFALHRSGSTSFRRNILRLHLNMYYVSYFQMIVCIVGRCIYKLTFAIQRFFFFVHAEKIYGFHSHTHFGNYFNGFHTILTPANEQCLYRARRILRYSWFDTRADNLTRNDLWLHLLWCRI